MTSLLLPRRKFLTGLVGLIAVPAVVKAASLMPVRGWIDPYPWTEVSSGFAVSPLTQSWSAHVAESWHKAAFENGWTERLLISEKDVWDIHYTRADEIHCEAI